MTKDTEIPACDRRIDQAGMMRCCVETLERSHDLTAVGDVIECRYGSTKLRVREDGAWQADFITDRRAR